MNDFTLDFAFAFLHYCIACRKDIRHILGVLVVLHHDNITTHHYPFLPQVCHTITHKRNVLTCYCKQDVAVVCIFLCWLPAFICMGHTLIKPNIVSGMYLAVSDTRYAFVAHFFSFDACTSIPFSSHISKFLPLHILSAFKGQ